MASQPKSRVNIDLTADVMSFLDEFSEEVGITKSEVMRRAIGLLKVAHDERKRGRSVGFVASERDHLLETKLVGIF